MQKFRLPRDDEHCLITGKNGTGKSHAGLWQLSLRSYDVRPWIIVDIKRDDFIADIDEARPLKVSDRIPKEAGVYVVQPLPREIAQLDDMFMRIWEKRGVGTLVDEGYAIGARNEGYRTLLMQGRSLHCPTITLSQRPVYLDRYAVSEQTHYQAFRLNDRRDWGTLGEFTPLAPDQHYGKDPHNSLWYNSKADHVYKMAPAPSRETILETFDARIPRRKERWV